MKYIITVLLMALTISVNAQRKVNIQLKKELVGVVYQVLNNHLSGVAQKRSIELAVEKRSVEEHLDKFSLTIDEAGALYAGAQKLPESELKKALLDEIKMQLDLLRPKKLNQ